MSFFRHPDLLNYWKNIFKMDIFRKLKIRHLWLSILFLIINFFCKKINKSEVHNWECCLKRGPREANVFLVLPLDVAWDSTVDWNFCFLFTKWLIIRWSPKGITQHKVFVITIFFLILLNSICLNFCCLQVYCWMCELFAQVRLVN